MYEIIELSFHSGSKPMRVKLYVKKVVGRFLFYFL